MAISFDHLPNRSKALYHTFDKRICGVVRGVGQELEQA
jgi:hypothetical protein